MGGGASTQVNNKDDVIEEHQFTNSTSLQTESGDNDDDHSMSSFSTQSSLNTTNNELQLQPLSSSTTTTTTTSTNLDNSLTRITRQDLPSMSSQSSRDNITRNFISNQSNSSTRGGTEMTGRGNFGGGNHRVDDENMNLFDWLIAAGLHPAIAGEAVSIAVKKGLHTPKRLLFEWRINSKIFELFGCFTRHDINDIFETNLFKSYRENQEREVIEAQKKSNEAINLLRDDEIRNENLLRAETELLRDLVSRQASIDSAHHELVSRQGVESDRARRIAEETQLEMLQILEIAMRNSNYTSSLTPRDDGNNNYSGVDSFSGMNGIEINERLDNIGIDMSSPTSPFSLQSPFSTNIDVYDSLSSLFQEDLVNQTNSNNISRRNVSSNNLSNMDNSYQVTTSNNIISDNRSKITNTGKEILLKWDLQLSSPVFDYSSDFTSVIRRGSVGYQPAAFTAISARKSCITIKLDECPKKNNIFSFGFALLNARSTVVTGLVNEGTERCFGKQAYSWGVSDKRNTSAPGEIWSNGTKCGECRTFYENDIISLSLDLVKGIASLSLNGSLLFIFQGLPLASEAMYVYGTTLCDDHKVTIEMKEIADPPADLANMVNSSSITTTPQSTVRVWGRNVNQIPVPTTLVNTIQTPSPSRRPTPATSILPSSSVRLLSRGSSLVNNIVTATSTPLALSENKVINKPKEVKKVKESKEENKSTQEQESNLCCICLDLPKCIVLLPCRHLCICEECGNNSNLKTCPLCRLKCSDKIKVFV